MAWSDGMRSIGCCDHATNFTGREWDPTNSRPDQASPSDPALAAIDAHRYRGPFCQAAHQHDRPFGAGPTYIQPDRP